MLEWMLSSVVCPNCKGFLRSHKLIRRTGKVLGGSLLCDKCQEAYRIVSGIPVLLPPGEKYRGWFFPTQDIVTDPESFATKKPKERPPMCEVLAYFGKERVMEAIRQGTKLPPRRKEMADFDGPISPREKRCAYRFARQESAQRMIEVMKRKWEKNCLFTEFVNSVLELKPGILMDFATGPGGLLYGLLSDLSHTRIIGLEYSFRNSRMTQAGIECLNEESRAGMVEADARIMPLPTRYFDCVTSHFGSYHIPNYSLSIQEAYRVLKDDCWFMGTFHTSYPRLTNGEMKKEEEVLLLRYARLPVDIEDVESICRSVGFREIQKVCADDCCLIKARKS